MEVAHDLREIELRVKVRGEQVVHLALGIAVRVGPAAERERVIALAQEAPQLPGVLHAPGRPDRLVAAEDDQRREAALVRAFGVRQAVLDAVFRRQKRHDALARHVGAQIDDEVPEVVLLVRADGAVGEEDERALRA